MQSAFTIAGNIVDVVTKKIHVGKVVVENKKIVKIDITSDVPVLEEAKGPFIMPGFIDAHIHVEDTLMTPCELARVAVRCGTVASVCDPHEIANVMGIPGVQYMIEQGKKTPYKFFNGAPSCVPATEYETSGATLGPKEIEELMNNKDITHLSEFMRFPEVINKNSSDIEKIEIAKKTGKPIDGHAPGVIGEALNKYIAAGISTDHECTRLEEAKEKATKGMKIIIREGSAGHNLKALYPLIDLMPDKVMLCTDDVHADDLVYKGYMNHVVKMAMKDFKCDFFNVLRAASLNTVEHYKLPVGLLRVGDPADFILVDSLSDLNVLKTYIDGELVYESPNVLLPPVDCPILNNFNIEPITVDDVQVFAKGEKIHIIQVIDQELVTLDKIDAVTLDSSKNVISNPDADIIKIVVLNRYAKKATPAIGFIKGYGLKSGALAFSISHDSHNIVCVGVSDADIVKAVNAIIKHKGGAALSNGEKVRILPLPIAGLMSDRDADTVAKEYKELQDEAKKLGCKLTAPFPTLSFMCLTVIPDLKISDKGLFDVPKGKIIDLFDTN